MLPLMLGTGKTEACRVQAVADIEPVGKRRSPEDGLESLVQAQVLRIVRDYVIVRNGHARQHIAREIDRGSLGACVAVAPARHEPKKALPCAGRITRTGPRH